MVNINMLKGKIVERGMNVTKLASEIGIDRSSLYREINENGKTITIEEAENIKNVLQLTADEATSIFFAE